MKILKRVILPLATVVAFSSGTVFAQTAVHETASGDLRVIKFQGKPPFKRSVVSTTEGREYERFQQLDNSVLVSSTSSRRAGPPGKSQSANKATLEYVDRDQLVSIARFEETDKASSARMWRGAPGKGRPNLRR